jgi:hypothetical protein
MIFLNMGCCTVSFCVVRWSAWFYMVIMVGTNGSTLRHQQFVFYGPAEEREETVNKISYQPDPIRYLKVTVYQHLTSLLLSIT